MQEYKCDGSFPNTNSHTSSGANQPPLPRWVALLHTPLVGPRSVKLGSSARTTVMNRDKSRGGKTSTVRMGEQRGGAAWKEHRGINY